jgi:hypothetical protein
MKVQNYINVKNNNNIYIYVYIYAMTLGDGWIKIFFISINFF